MKVANLLMVLLKGGGGGGGGSGMLGALKVVLECFADETSGDCATELSEKVSPFFLLFSASPFWLLSVN